MCALTPPTPSPTTPCHDMRAWRENLLTTPARVAIPIMTHPGIDLVGRTVGEAVRDGATHAAAIAALAERYPSAARTVIMDLTVEAEAFGAGIQFGDHEIPAVKRAPLESLDDVESLAIPSITAGRIPEYLRASRLAAAQDTRTPLLAGCIGPFSLAGRLFDMTELMVSTYSDPELVEVLLDKCTQFLVDYARALKATGAGGLVIAEPAAGLLSPAMCRSFSSVFVKRMVDAVQDDHFLVVLHNCGNTGHATSAMVETGAQGLHFGNKIDMARVLEGVPADCLVMGNIDPVADFRTGTPAAMREKVLGLLAQCGPHRNFVLSSGCDTPPGVPTTNIEAFFASLAEYNRQL